MTDIFDKFKNPNKEFFRALEIGKPVFAHVSKENTVMKLRAACAMYGRMLQRDFECRRELNCIIKFWRNK